MNLNLPDRKDDRPTTTNTNPHEQLTQNPDPEMHRRFKSQAFNFKGVIRTPSIISVPGAEALWLEEDQPCNCVDGFMIGREFAHIHPEYDGSLHMVLNQSDFHEVIKKKWGEKHPLAGKGPIPETIVMVYAPRNDKEIKIVLDILTASWRHATSP